jgi:hypothetical protein
LKFRMKRKKDKKKNSKLEVIDIAIELIEPIFLLSRFLIRSLFKFVQ